MRKITLLFVILFAAMFVYSQNENNDPQNMDINYTREASYPGGMNKLIGDIWKEMEFTQDAIDRKIDDELLVSFDVNADSTVSGIILLNSIGYGVDEEFSRVLGSFKFLPALAQGNPLKMNVIIGIPIRTGPNSKKKTQ